MVAASHRAHFCHLKFYSCLKAQFKSTSFMKPYHHRYKCFFPPLTGSYLFESLFYYLHWVLFPFISFSSPLFFPYQPVSEALKCIVCLVYLSVFHKAWHRAFLLHAGVLNKYIYVGRIWGTGLCLNLSKWCLTHYVCTEQVFVECIYPGFGFAFILFLKVHRYNLIKWQFSYVLHINVFVKNINSILRWM